jgi:hypothetical protein
MAIWYILWPFDIFYGHLVYCTEINLATLVGGLLPKPHFFAERRNVFEMNDWKLKKYRRVQNYQFLINGDIASFSRNCTFPPVSDWMAVHKYLRM